MPYSHTSQHGVTKTPTASTVSDQLKMLNLPSLLQLSRSIGNQPGTGTFGIKLEIDNSIKLDYQLIFCIKRHRSLKN